MYLIIAYRWGDNQVLKEHDNFETNKYIKHSYPVGLHCVKESAEIIADEERIERGGKYECLVYEVEENRLIDSSKIVYSTMDE